MSTIHTGIRMDSSLYERLKMQARKQNRSLNNFVVTILENATAPVFPRLTESDLQLDEDILKLGDIFGEIPVELVERDPKLAYILSK